MNLTRESKVATPTEEIIYGDKMIDELIQKLIILILIAVDLHGQLGPFMMRFLFGTTPQPMTFQSQRSNAREMYRRLTTSSCPSGFIIQAAIKWKKESATYFTVVPTPLLPPKNT